MDLLAVQALVGSLRAAAEASKALFDLKLNAEVHEKVSELQSALLAAQSSALEATSAQFELQERVRDLEGRLRAVTDWDEIASRYALVTPWRGAAQAYALRRARADGEEPHFLCTNCFHQSKRVILNPTTSSKWIVMSCPSCRATLDTGFAGIGRPKYAEELAQADPAA